MGWLDQGRKERFAATTAPHSGLGSVRGSRRRGVGGPACGRSGLWCYESPVYRGLAEYALASAAMVSRKPTSLTHIEAASVPVIAVTAWQALFDQAQLKAGQTVVIHGAAGNVGAYAVQLARRADVRIIATAATDDILFLRNLGANTVIDYKTQRFEEEVRDADAVIDLVGGETQKRSFQVLHRGGKLISAVSPPDQHLAQSRGVEAGFFLVNVTTQHLAEIAGLIDGGKLRTRTSRGCARGSFHAGTLTASAERKDRAYRRGKLSD
jgi:NADPH:quinone reductase-like Zn-dependent oxidoreductase